MSRGKPIPGRIDTPTTIGARIHFDPELFLALLNHETRSHVHESRGRRIVIPQVLNAPEVGSHLRSYVDEFLDTGLHEGVETPHLRDLNRAPTARCAFHRFDDNNPPRFSIAGDTVTVSFGLGRPISLGELMRGLTAQPPEEATVVASGFFGLLFLSGWQKRLGKCRTVGCGRYFWMKHWNRTYKRGILCPECQRGRSLESAVRSTSKARESAEKELYRLAAQRFGKRLLKTSDWRSNRQFKTAIVDFLNSQIKGTDSLKSVYPRGITGKWLSWSKNRDGIEKTARGVDNAKG